MGAIMVAMDTTEDMDTVMEATGKDMSIQILYY